MERVAIHRDVSPKRIADTKKPTEADGLEVDPELVPASTSDGTGALGETIQPTAIRVVPWD